MSAFRYPTKRNNKETKLNAKDFANIRKAIGQLIAAEELHFFSEVNGDKETLNAKQRLILSSYFTTLKKIAVLRKKK